MRFLSSAHPTYLLALMTVRLSVGKFILLRLLSKVQNSTYQWHAIPEKGKQALLILRVN